MDIRPVTVSSTDAKFRQLVRVGELSLDADEPKDLGGDDAGLAPHELVLAGLGACTSMTLRMYAERKGWPLSAVRVVLGAERGTPFTITRRIELEGPLDAEQRQRLLEIANKCPVHKTLTGAIAIESELAENP